jgi:ParB/RepB/Spo0J family partition protein
MGTDSRTQFAVVPPEQIAFDAKNPRGETKEQIEQDGEFHELTRSVGRHGVLVPVIVRRNGDPLRPFTLVDGERRLRAALAQKKDSIPVHIIEDEECSGRVLAYQIHMLRKQWDKRSELNSIREIIEELRAEQKDISESDLFKRLKDVTSHRDHDLKTLLTLAEYDDATTRKVQDYDTPGFLVVGQFESFRSIKSTSSSSSQI